ncbi:MULTISPECIES: SDR family NAD(P)-dependent oxidoreductase [Stutzerimonas stutzeri group]|jgi:meso-butanediol dehydrogenase/(S,S)-butanediol dehydrogenase/diacetyl reductase|uniref:SDR family NAD(P)-dependent oxidoreductase n=3 Tax=Stutzerimonas stutzeri group TaxID=136846 RepID=A0A6A9R6J8_STUST|nr:MULTISPECIES: SDR family NAD(P)-dependent oxidoreductase [Stutzerimonas stutzeri group]MAE23236.1 short-chain dehydrogenase [Pseudomonas sp.]MBW8338691.1 SDR family oxidoreductase [Pseudomonas sp.]MUT71608.1 SDR family NAD(P)-dependent oxidoreductase [Stutzerimonas frequens]QGZ31086.1 SDR family NAD(P)-dependent oxidoreductase [Stutzerimonas stutzeri]RRV44178.1 SDR family oxidoreductase [Stutzerimonas stutzeri]|tara:strand:- start:1987 stop:2787 length:801 start_codon:yes stop_codon:yes gene_type:complete
MSESTAVDFSLVGKVALVTGAGRGIGQGIALSLAKAGADLVLADYDLGIAEEAAARVRAIGRRAIALQVDVSQPDSVGAMIEQVREHYGRLDVAVNNAGVVSLGKVDELPVSEWDRIMNINARGVFLCCQAELRLMREHRFGRIINLASIAGKVGFPDLSHYSASKFAVIGFSNAFAKEVAREGITVNALCPGVVGTGMWRGDEGLSSRWAEPGETEEQSWERHQAALLPQGEAQTVEDMGQLAVYLACAPHVTGQAIAVDGGFSL